MSRLIIHQITRDAANLVQLSCDLPHVHVDFYKSLHNLMYDREVCELSRITASCCLANALFPLTFPILSPEVCISRACVYIAHRPWRRDEINREIVNRFDV